MVLLLTIGLAPGYVWQCPFSTMASAAESNRERTRPLTGSGGDLEGKSITPEQVVDVLSDRALFPLPLESAAAKLRNLVSLHRESPAPEVVLLVGARPGLSRVEIAYGEDGKGGWVFSQATLLLATRSEDNLAEEYRRLEAALRARLGKPRFTKRNDGKLPRQGWALRRPLELWLGEESGTIPGEVAPRRHIRVDIAAPGGEAD